MQVEAIREHVTRFTGARASGDNAALASVKQALAGLMEKFIADVDRDKEDGLDPDTGRMWKDQVHQMVEEAEVFQDSLSGAGAAPPAAAEPTALKPADGLFPLRLAIRLATHTMEAAAREIQDPDETTLRGFAKHLGNSKKEIMALSRSLMVGQAASMATEATRLADQAGEAIKSSRELIRAALRGLGVDWTYQRPAAPLELSGPPDKARDGGPEHGLGDGTPAGCLSVAARLHAGHHRVASRGLHAKTQDEGDGGRVVNPYARHDECPSKRQRVAHLQREVCGVPPIPQGVVGLQADIPWARARRAGVPQPQGAEPS